MLYLNLRQRLLHTTRQFSSLIDFSAADASLSKLAVQVIPDAITQAQHDALCAELEPVFKRKRYEKGHWDAVIEDYKESERLDVSWSAVNRATVEQVCPLQPVFIIAVIDVIVSNTSLRVLHDLSSDIRLKLRVLLLLHSADPSARSYACRHRRMAASARHRSDSSRPHTPSC
jgi:hypothetical protein